MFNGKNHGTFFKVSFILAGVYYFIFFFHKGNILDFIILNIIVCFFLLSILLKLKNNYTIS